MLSTIIACCAGLIFGYLSNVMYKAIKNTETLTNDIRNELSRLTDIDEIILTRKVYVVIIVMHNTVFVKGIFFTQEEVNAYKEKNPFACGVVREYEFDIKEK